MKTLKKAQIKKHDSGMRINRKKYCTEPIASK